MSPGNTRLMLQTAAAFNGLVALGLAVDVEMLFGWFRVTPSPTEPLFVYLFAWLVFAFGVGYFWASRDPAGNRPLIRLGIVGKLGVVAVALVSTVTGVVSWQLMILAGADLVYAVLFWRALVALRN